MVNSVQNKRHVFNPPNNFSKTPVYDAVWRNKKLKTVAPDVKKKSEGKTLAFMTRFLMGVAAITGLFYFFKTRKGSLNKLA